MRLQSVLWASWNLASQTSAAGSCSPESFGALPAGVSILNTTGFPTSSAANVYGQSAADDPGYNPAYAWNFPALCAVIAGVVEGNSSYNLGLFLPGQWGGKFLVVGGYSFAGGINWHDMSPGPWYGMATVTTDTGHLSAAADQSWAADPGLRAEWGSAAMHGAVTHGKMLTEAFYGSGVTGSYYSGCSTGGRQGLKEAQEHPDSFDGLMIGAPAWNTRDYMPWLTRIGVWNRAGNATRLNDSDFGTLAAFVQAQCDAQDGLEDGVVSSPETCRINWDDIQCGSSSNPSPCLSSGQVEIAQLVYGDYYIDGGADFVHNGFEVSSEEQWPTFLTGSSTTGFDGDYERYFLNYGPDWQTTSYNSSTVLDSRARENGVATADKFELRTNSKGVYPKIFMYHGMADGVIPFKSSELYYNRTQSVMSGVNVTDFFRFFSVPGMQHCWDTPSPLAFTPSRTTVDAPWAFGGGGQAGYLQDFSFGDGWSVPGFENNSRYDAFAALVDWVELDVAVDSVVATMWERGNGTVYTSGEVLRQRPICAWPKRAVFIGGSADPDLESKPYNDARLTFLCDSDKGIVVIRGGRKMPLFDFEFDRHGPSTVRVLPPKTPYLSSILMVAWTY
ncbi:hypothetical protein Daus18300_011889 [Diaporthe australafricana]|uniref:Carboxylic ester hydrolase n=1 Tax=Diaporthe australafricana TaxID=127596 RepID=A0ABR3W4W1_9PEZI